MTDTHEIQKQKLKCSLVEWGNGGSGMKLQEYGSEKHKWGGFKLFVPTWCAFLFLLSSLFTQLSPESPLLSISLLFCGLFIFHSNHPQNPKFCLFFFFGWRSHKVWKLIIFLQALCAQTKIPFLVLTYHHFVKKVSTFIEFGKKVKTLWENIQTGEK